jgi:hypothetical protein
VYTFRVNGAIHHKIGPLLPDQGVEPNFAQIYFFDSDYQVNRRSKIFSKEAAISKNIIRDIQNLLHQINPYVKQYRYASELLNTDPGVDLKIVLFQDNQADRRRYNTPTASEVAAIVVGSDEDRVNYSRQIRLYKKGGEGDHYLKIISDDHSAYDPLHYVLLHPYGDHGWGYKLYRKFSIEPAHSTADIRNIQSDSEIPIPENSDQISTISETDNSINSVDSAEYSNRSFDDEDIPESLNDSGSSSQSKWVSCCEFYKNRLMIFHDSYFHLCGRLLQQYIVDNYLKVENQKLKYFIFHQDQIRIDLYKGRNKTFPNLLSKT